MEFYRVNHLPTAVVGTPSMSVWFRKKQQNTTQQQTVGGIPGSYSQMKNLYRN